MANLDVSVLYPSKYLKAEDLKGKQVTVRVTRIERDRVPMAQGKEEDCTVVHLAKTSKLWIAGKTNGYALGVLFDRDIAHAIGKRITLVADVDFLGKSEVPCIRVQGSPDATPERSAAYARAWRGKRVRGALVARLKLELAKLTPVQAPPIEPEDVDVDETQVADEPERAEDMFDDDPGPDEPRPPPAHDPAEGDPGPAPAYEPGQDG